MKKKKKVFLNKDLINENKRQVRNGKEYYPAIPLVWVDLVTIVSKEICHPAPFFCEPYFELVSYFVRAS